MRVLWCHISTTSHLLTLDLDLTVNSLDPTLLTNLCLLDPKNYFVLDRNVSPLSMAPPANLGSSFRTRFIGSKNWMDEVLLFLLRAQLG